MKSDEIVGYTADADSWCPECAIRAYGDEIAVMDVPDREGNSVHPVFASDDHADMSCCKCLEMLDGSGEDGCSRDWDDDQCSGRLVWRTTSGGFRERICQGHLDGIQRTLDLIAQRYPEIYHEENCTCWGCTDGSY